MHPNVENICQVGNLKKRLVNKALKPNLHIFCVVYQAFITNNLKK